MEKAETVFIGIAWACEGYKDTKSDWIIALKLMGSGNYAKRKM
jgi:hypothetical protein